jgi:hypothetical protein
MHLACCLPTWPFAQVFTSGRLDVYILVPMLWALYNAIPPLLFFVYFFTKGKVLQGLCSIMQVLGVIFAAGEITRSIPTVAGSVLGFWVRVHDPEDSGSGCFLAFGES